MHLGDQVCSKTCDEHCPPGWQCSLVTMAGSDPAQVCVSKAGQLCRPCTTHEDCASDEGEAPCLSYGEAGAFCGAPCDETSPCPTGYTCEETSTSDGGLSIQCVAESGACACSETSTSLALSTPCAITNTWGTCHGLNRCAPQGLTGCDALTPAQETCNGIDDDCDDEVDEVDCDDGDPCTTDSCGGEAGCIHELAEDADCDDGNPCTIGEVCSDDGCTPTAAKDCDDENPCTTDSCVPDLGCVHEANTAPCDDGDACTLGDLCSNEACQAGVESFSCEDQNPCTDQTCDPTLGCIFVTNEEACDDTNVCTTGDHCSGGLCGGDGILDCDDANPCTKDTCLVGGGCHYEPLAGSCSDGDPCTIEDQCEAGQCVSGAPKSCDDFNPCTDDLCGALGGCDHGANEAACEDGNPCTLGDHCADGVCQVEVMMLCNDQSPCTLDYCDPNQGCQTTPVPGACSDNDVCTLEDTCGDGVCLSGPSLDCDDQNPCTTDSCDPELGCEHVDNALDCDDEDACTLGEACADGSCVGGDAIVCDDDNPCTIDSCNVADGCHNDAADLVCDDGNPCTTGDHCVDTSCVAASETDCDDLNPCTTDSCDPALGCQHVDNILDCDDEDACTLGEMCSGGSCVGGVAIECDDDNGCTIDSCNVADGCHNDAAELVCDDGNACTTGDYCVDKTCVSGPPIVCDDEVLCTADSCDPDTGCTATPVPGGLVHLGACWLLLDTAVDDEPHCTSKCAEAGMLCTSENLSLIDSCDRLKTLSSLLGAGIDHCNPGYNRSGSPMVLNQPGVNPNSGMSLNKGYYHEKEDGPSSCHDPPLPFTYFSGGWKHLCGCD